MDTNDIEKLACDSVFRHPDEIQNKPSRKALGVAIKRLQHCIVILKDMKRKEFPPDALEEVVAFLTDLKAIQEKTYARYLKKFDATGPAGLQEFVDIACPVIPPEPETEVPSVHTDLGMVTEL